MPSLSAVIITYNEACSIARALRSLSCADELLVVDSGSTDATCSIAIELGARVLINPWPGYSAQKNYAADQARQDWILSLDADEELNSEAQAAILAWRSSNPRPDIAGYQLARRARFLGRWIRHSGWYPDYKLRLFDRRRGRWQGGYVHEAVQVAGAVETFPGEILHYTCDSLEESFERAECYAELAARQMFEQQQNPRALLRLVAPTARFARAYLLHLGFLDGSAGYWIARMEARCVRMKLSKLAEMCASARKP